MLPPIGFPTLGWQVIDWIETYLVHGPGDVERQPIVLDDERALHVLWCYAVFPAGHRFAGQRMVLRDVLSRPKGWAKSEFAGAIACVEALGPSRFDGWDTGGEPVGRPVTYPFVRCLATEEEQAGNTYDNVFIMLSEGEAANAYDLDVGLTRTFVREPGGGEIRPSSSGDSSKDGGKESFAVADETHLYHTRGLRSMHRTVARNTGKRKGAEPWMLDTTTAHAPGENSVAEAAADSFADTDPAVLLERQRVLYDHHEGPEVRNWDSDRELRAALKKAYGGAAAFMDLDRVLALIRMPEAEQAESKRYFLNIASASDRIWVAADEVRGLLHRGHDRQVRAGELITVGFDGSRFRDATVLIGCCVSDAHLFPLGVWAKPEGEAGRGWEVPVRDVNLVMERTFDSFRVERGYYDAAWWRAEVAAWHSKWGDAVADFDTTSDTRMARACGNARTIVRTGAASLGGNPDQVATVAGHLRNARMRKVRLKLDDVAEEAHVIEKKRRGSPDKIDGATAVALALEARSHAIADGALGRLEPPDRSLYRFDFLDS